VKRVVGKSTPIYRLVRDIEDEKKKHKKIWSMKWEGKEHLKKSEEAISRVICGNGAPDQDLEKRSRRIVTQMEKKSGVRRGLRASLEKIQSITRGVFSISSS